MNVTTIRLVLPIPDPPNRWPAHPMERHKAKRGYQREAWLLACTQVPPSPSPPEKVRVTATLYVRNLRDDDGATGSLKWPLDALRQAQAGSVAWRGGWADGCGYFVDDDPAHLELARPRQVIDRERPRLELEIEEVTSTERST